MLFARIVHYSYTHPHVYLHTSAVHVMSLPPNYSRLITILILYLFLLSRFESHPLQVILHTRQIGRSELPQLKDFLLSIFRTYPTEMSLPLRRYLCVCLANIALQSVDWKDVIPEIQAFSEEIKNPTVLFDFLRVLPEEFSTNPKNNLTVCVF